MGYIEEELGSARLRLTGIGHGKGADVIADFLVGLAHLVGDSTVMSAGDGLAVARLEGGVGIRSAGAGATGVGVLGVRASKLVHEVRDNTVDFVFVAVADAWGGGGGGENWRLKEGGECFGHWILKFVIYL